MAGEAISPLHLRRLGQRFLLASSGDGGREDEVVDETDPRVVVVWIDLDCAFKLGAHLRSDGRSFEETRMQHLAAMRECEPVVDVRPGRLQPRGLFEKWNRRGIVFLLQRDLAENE